MQNTRHRKSASTHTVCFGPRLADIRFALLIHGLGEPQIARSSRRRGSGFLESLEMYQEGQ